MGDAEILEEIREIIENRRMKATGKLDAIADVLENAGYAGEEEDQDEGDDGEGDDGEEDEIAVPNERARASVGEARAP